MEGESREMRVLFSDVRDFTTMSESLDAARARGAAERLPDDDDRGDPRAARHGRQVHRRRDHGVLGRAARRTRTMRPTRCRRRSRCSARCPAIRAGLRARAAGRRSRWASASTPGDERRRHGLALPPGLHGARRRGEPRVAPRGPDQGVRRADPVRRRHARARSAASSGARSTACASRVVRRRWRSTSRSATAGDPRAIGRAERWAGDARGLPRAAASAPRAQRSRRTCPDDTDATLAALFAARCAVFAAAPPPADWDGAWSFVEK